MILPQGQAIKAIINAPCLVASDRAGRALFISDYPRRLGDGAFFASARLTQAGYVLSSLPRGMALIDWPLPHYLAWYQAQPEPEPLPGYGRAAALHAMLRRHPGPLAQQDAQVLARALRLALLGRQDALCHLLESAFAAALRERRAPPWHGLKALQLLIKTTVSQQERSNPC